MTITIKRLAKLSGFIAVATSLTSCRSETRIQIHAETGSKRVEHAFPNIVLKPALTPEIQKHNLEILSKQAGVRFYVPEGKKVFMTKELEASIGKLAKDDKITIPVSFNREIHSKGINLGSFLVCIAFYSQRPQLANAYFAAIKNPAALRGVTIQQIFLPQQLGGFSAEAQKMTFVQTAIEAGYSYILLGRKQQSYENSNVALLFKKIGLTNEDVLRFEKLVKTAQNTYLKLNKEHIFKTEDLKGNLLIIEGAKIIAKKAHIVYAQQKKAVARPKGLSAS